MLARKCKGGRNVKLTADDYMKLITSEHKKPKFSAWVQSSIEKQEEISQLNNNLIQAFLLSSAVGVQLDTIGEFIGVKRKLVFQPGDGSSPILDDDLYRKLLLAWVVRNNWDGTNGTMSNIWNKIFSGSQLNVVDNQDMTMTAIVTNLGDQPLLQELVDNGYIVPKPQCVRLKVIFKEIIEIDRMLAVATAVMDFGKMNTEAG